MRVRSTIGWGVFLFLISIIVNVLPSPEATYYFLIGKQRFSSRDYQGANAAFQQSVNADPKFARGFVELGVSYYTLEKYPEAEQAFRRAMAIEEESCAACGLGMIYRLEKRRDEAEATLKQSIKLNPKDDCPYDQLARLYYDEKEYAKAIEVFQQEIKLKPSAISYHFLANSLYYSNKVQESIQPYLEATRLDPNYEKVLVDLGNAYHVLGRETEAIDALQRAIELDPEDQRAHSYLSVAKFVVEDKQGAMEQYEWLLSRNPRLASQLLLGLHELAETAAKAKKH